MYFIEGTSSQGIREIDDPTLNFYLRWGYGDVEDNGLSRVFSCKLTNIQYRFSQEDEKIIVLSFADNLTFALNNDPSHKGGLDTVNVVSVNCLEDGGLRLPGEVIGELISKYMSTCAGVKPISLMYDSGGPGVLIDSLYGTLANRISSGGLHGNIAIEGQSDEIDVLSDNFVGLNGPNIDSSQLGGFSGINFDFIPGATWDDVKVGTSPSNAHKVAAYQMLMSNLGLNFSIGYKEDNTIPNTEDALTEVALDEGSQLSAAQQANYSTVFDEFQFPMSPSDIIFNKDGVQVGTVGSILAASDPDNIFPDSSFSAGEYMFSPAGVSPVLYGTALSFDNPSNTYTFDKRFYYVNAERTHYLNISTLERGKLSLGLFNVANELDSEQNPDLNKVLEPDPPSTMRVNSDELYASITLGKSISYNSLHIIERLINAINKEILPGEANSGDFLSMLQIPWSTLNEDNKVIVGSKLGSMSALDSDTIMMIASRQSIRTLFAGDVPQAESYLKIQSFPSLQVGNTLNLSVGYDDSIVTNVDFNESILAMFPDSIMAFNTFKSIASLYVEEGTVRSWRDVSNILLFEVSPYSQFLPTSNVTQFGFVPLSARDDIIELRSVTNEVEFYSKYVNFVTRAERGEYGDAYKGIILSLDYASSFVKMANGNALRVFFGDYDERNYTYETSKGAVSTGVTVDFKSISIGDTLKGFIYDKGDFDVSEYIRIKVNNYLYSAASFSVTVTTLGIPEVSNVALDLGGRGSRRVHLRVSETRLPGSAEHWLSGFYNIIGYTHTYNVSKGYTSRFNLVRVAYASKEDIFNA